MVVNHFVEMCKPFLVAQQEVLDLEYSLQPLRFGRQ